MLHSPPRASQFEADLASSIPVAMENVVHLKDLLDKVFVNRGIEHFG